MLLQGKRIYVVEDNPDNIYVILLLLRKQGAEVQVDWWAKGESRRILEALPLDLIILDIMLTHGRSGFDVFDELRQWHDLSRIPVVAVSAADPSIALHEARIKGFAGFISKPVDFNLFPSQIASLIAGKQLWDVED